MANLKISQLTPGNPAQSGDVIPIERSDVNFSITAGSIAALASGVTSVGFEGDGTVLSSVESGPVTSSGILSATLKTQSANLILAGPTTGSAATPTFRALVSADIPTTSWSALTSATANLTLANAGYTSTFNQTSAVSWKWANTTSATSSTAQSSPLLELAGTYWNGSASASDTWTIQDVVGTGYDANSFASTPANGSRNNLTGALGFTFTVNAPLLVTTLGRHYATGNTANHQVTLWLSTNTSTPLAQATVLASSSSDANNFKYVSITPVILYPGNTYAIASDELNGGDVWNDQFAPSLISQIATFTAAFTTTAGVYPSNAGTANQIYSTPALGGIVLATSQLSLSQSGAPASGMLLPNSATATSSTALGSPTLAFNTNYWTGSASAVDDWTIQQQLGVGTNAASTLLILHSGTTGTAVLQAPNLSTPGTVSANTITTFGAAALSIATTISIPAGQVYEWSTDTGVSRKAAKVVAIGNGTQGDTTGTLALSRINGYSADMQGSVSSAPTGIVATNVVVAVGAATATFTVSSTEGFTVGDTVNLSASGWTAGSGLASTVATVASVTSTTVLVLTYVSGGPWVAGTYTAQTGTLTQTGGTSVSVKYAVAYTSTPTVVVTPTSNAGAFYISASSTTGFTITYTSSGTQTFSYQVMGNPS